MSNKDFENSAEDFNFSDPNWDAEEKTPTKSSTKADDAFAAPDFAEDDDDHSFTSFGDFGALPTQDSLSKEASKGNPDAEFGDFTDSTNTEFENPEFEEFSSSASYKADDEDDFDNAFAPQQRSKMSSGMNDFDDVNNDPLGQSSNFNDGYTNDEDVADPYDAVASNPYAVQPNATAAANNNKPLFAKLIVPVGMAAVLGVAAFFGYNFYANSSVAPVEKVAVAEPSLSDNAFPTQLPAQDSGASNNTAENALPSNSPVVLVGNADESDTSLTINLPGTSSEDGQTDATIPQKTSPAEPPKTVAATETPPSGLATPVPVASESDSNKAVDVSAEPVPAPAASGSDLEKLVSENQKQIETIVARLDKLEQQLAAQQKPAFSPGSNDPLASVKPVPAPSDEIAEDQNSMTVDNKDGPAVVDMGGLNPEAKPTASLDSVSPPLKPIILEEFSLKGVSRDVAWVKKGKETMEVRVNDEVVDAGRVVKIRSYQGKWLVVTTKGVIVQ